MRRRLLLGFAATASVFALGLLAGPAGAGNSNLYQLRLPTDPQLQPNQSGTAGTWNFQLHPAFWLGMALCDNQSAPEYTQEPCKPDTDENIFNGTDPAAHDYIGKHPGTA